MMRLIESYLTENPCFKKETKQEIGQIIVQLVNTPQPSAKVFMHNWNRETGKACPHVLVDCFSGDAYHVLPWSARGAYYGRRIPKDTAMVFLCEPSNAVHEKNTGVINFVGDAEKAKEQTLTVYKSAISVCEAICCEFNLDPRNAVLVHNRYNPENIWSHLQERPTIDDFRNEIVARLSGVTDPFLEQKENISNNALEDTPSLSDCPPAPERETIKVDFANLRIRTGPGKTYTSTGFTGIGTFEICERQNGSGSVNGWGKLASGEGWVSLDYVRFV